MCGLLFLTRETGEIAKPTLKRYKAQETRGQDGFGFVAFNDQKVIAWKRAETENDIRKELLACADAKGVLFHHRYPTSTPNIKEAAHPIRVSHKELGNSVYYVAHNGVISNALSLKAEHDKLGYKYTTEISETTIVKPKRGRARVTTSRQVFNDSETLAIDFIRTVNGLQPTMKTDGSIAVIAIETDKAGNLRRLLYGRNYRNPLVVEKSDGFFCLRSQGAGQEIAPNILYSHDYKTGATTEATMTIGVTPPPISSYPYYGGYQQPQPLGFQAPTKTEIVTSQTVKEQIDTLEYEILVLDMEIDGYIEGKEFAAVRELRQERRRMIAERSRLYTSMGIYDYPEFEF